MRYYMRAGLYWETLSFYVLDRYIFIINLCCLDFVLQMTPFDSSSIKDMLPKLDDGHRIKFPTGWDFEAVLSHITNCDLTTTRTGTFLGQIYNSFHMQLNETGIWLRPNNASLAVYNIIIYFIVFLGFQFFGQRFRPVESVA